MGDRCVVAIRSSTEYATCAAYLHWDGHRVLDLLKKALPHMRRGDANYSMARFIGVCHTEIPGNCSLGVLACDPETIEDPATSHGDAGVIVFNCSIGDVFAYNGYIAQERGMNPVSYNPELIGEEQARLEARQEYERNKKEEGTSGVIEGFDPDPEGMFN